METIELGGWEEMRWIRKKKTGWVFAYKPIIEGDQVALKWSGETLVVRTTAVTIVPDTESTYIVEYKHIDPRYELMNGISHQIGMVLRVALDGPAPVIMYNAYQSMGEAWQEILAAIYNVAITDNFGQHTLREAMLFRPEAEDEFYVYWRIGVEIMEDEEMEIIYNAVARAVKECSDGQ